MISVLYFSASWCAPCRTFGPMLDRLSTELGFNVTKVDVDNDPSREADKWGVASIPSTVWIKDGVMKTMLRGAYPEPQVRSVIKGL